MSLCCYHIEIICGLVRGGSSNRDKTETGKHDVRGAAVRCSGSAGADIPPAVSQGQEKAQC